MFYRTSVRGPGWTVFKIPSAPGQQRLPPVVARTPPLLHTVARRRAPAPRALVSSFSFLLEEVSLHGVLVREHSCAACSPSASWALPHDPRGQLPLAGGPVLFLRENLLTAYSRCGDMPHASPGWDAVSRNKRLSLAWAAQRLAHWDCQGKVLTLSDRFQLINFSKSIVRATSSHKMTRAL